MKIPGFPLIKDYNLEPAKIELINETPFLMHEGKPMPLLKEKELYNKQHLVYSAWGLRTDFFVDFGKEGFKKLVPK
jgi:hypothetical protein